MNRLLALCLLTLAAALPFAPAAAQILSHPVGAQPLDHIAAVVNDDVILQSELNEALHSVQQQYASHPGQLPPLDVLRRQVLERLILMKLQVQNARDQGIRVSNDDVDQAVAVVAQQNNISPDQLRAAVEREGSFTMFRNQLGDQVLVQRLHENVVREKVSVTDSEINNLLNSNTYKGGEIHLAHIQISIPSGANAQQIAKAAAKAEEAVKAIKGGMDFHAAAIRYSDAQDALEGGDLGWRRLDEIPPAFVDTVSAMKKGDISPALRGPTGFHIIELIDQRLPESKLVTEFHARQILLKSSELLSPEQAEQQADDLYQQIVDKHADFAKLAKQHSKDPTTANAGGDMGWFTQNDWGAAVAGAITKLKDNEIAPPFQTVAGWHILQRLGERQRDRTTEIKHDEARQAIGNRKADQVYDDFLRQLRSEAYVQILRPELQDPSKVADKSP